MTNITLSIEEQLNQNIFADEELLAKSWLSKEDNLAWKDPE